MVLGAALLGLVFLMAPKIWAQYGQPPQPSIWAVPGSVISTGSAVTFFCRTPPGVTDVHLINDKVWFDCTLQGDQEVCEFSLQNVIHRDAGVYHCDYYDGGKWLQSNDILELVVTGVYMEKPFLTVDFRPQGFSEINATLHCHIHGSFNIFILCRDGNASNSTACLLCAVCCTPHCYSDWNCSICTMDSEHYMLIILFWGRYKNIHLGNRSLYLSIMRTFLKDGVPLDC
ncbi:leukocyte immunoglobulin-like receptor subfamily A member 2 [Peromyscus maniculatus bairdii]|uniref:leukocyte immunoglobulin-like receptor subfamily A member 2 n=1 Tax=Peromyscus maniculatus bairdii TaxID=230844 RepID=UPI003FCFE6B4